MNLGSIDMSNARTTIAGAGARTAALALTICAGLACSAQAETVATIAPAFSPNRLGARASLTFAVHYAGNPSGVPSPVRRSVLRMPAGLTLDIPHLSSCSPTRLRARGPGGCPARSRLGNGKALVETHAGSQTITEEATMWAFLGPPHNLQPTFEILAQGYTPLDQRMVLSGIVLPAKAPYGEELVMTIPPIPSLELLPDASVVDFSLTIGAGRRHGKHGPITVRTPSTCPTGGFPFAAEFSYADGSSGGALATTPCPR
jgi:hypothetical protein